MTEFEILISNIFNVCVYILQVIGGSPGEFGHGYYLANIIIFILLQPALIVLFYILWKLEKRKGRKSTPSK